MYVECSMYMVSAKAGNELLEEIGERVGGGGNVPASCVTIGLMDVSLFIWKITPICYDLAQVLFATW